ncbi:aminodeoxychorismate/anthranilate synthase component II [Candidatus Micrarchaeota archaeon]|nr:aminodeoxychorismate/anthranilate synthase component II [Candidatus Micrarchaeota archaeon]
MRILLIDNFDSFTYNLYQAIGSLGHTVQVKRNDEISVEGIAREKYDAIVISPGPGAPENEKDFGVCAKAIEELGKNTPLLGVCLGHQGIALVFGGKVVRAKNPMHGKTSIVRHNGEGIFEGVANPLRVMRYHSLIVQEESFPSCLQICATSNEGEIMALRHRQYPIFGVQFHPESIMAQDGKLMLENFCKIAGLWRGK